jgi:hypothetical protein
MSMAALAARTSQQRAPRVGKAQLILAAVLQAEKQTPLEKNLGQAVDQCATQECTLQEKPRRMRPDERAKGHLYNIINTFILRMPLETRCTTKLIIAFRGDFQVEK